MDQSGGDTSLPPNSPVVSSSVDGSARPGSNVVATAHARRTTALAPALCSTLTGADGRTRGVGASAPGIGATALLPPPLPRWNQLRGKHGTGHIDQRTKKLYSKQLYSTAGRVAAATGGNSAIFAAAEQQRASCLPCCCCHWWQFSHFCSCRAAKGTWKHDAVTKFEVLTRFKSLVG
jgi:hypothetical protein